MYNEDLQELYHVTWRPQSTTSHPLDNPLQSMPTPHASALAYLGTVKTPSKPAGAYRPPGARGSVTPLAFKREDEGGAAYVSNGSLSLGNLGVNGFGKPRRREVPGAETTVDGNPGGPSAAPAASAEGDENLSKAAAKNKKKREARKAKDAAEKTAGLAPIADGAAAGTAPSSSRSPERRVDRKGHERNRSRGRVDAQPHLQQGKREPRQGERQHAQPMPKTNGKSTKAPPPPSEAPEVSVTSPISDNSPQDKKTRALLKKLRAIDDLKMRRAGGEKLEGTQIKKMDTEDEIRRELEGLGWKD